jgi:hypothetical protein
MTQEDHVHTSPTDASHMIERRDPLLTRYRFSDAVIQSLVDKGTNPQTFSAIELSEYADEVLSYDEQERLLAAYEKSGFVTRSTYVA